MNIDDESYGNSSNDLVFCFPCRHDEAIAMTKLARGGLIWTAAKRFVVVVG